MCYGFNNFKCMDLYSVYRLSMQEFVHIKILQRNLYQFYILSQIIRTYLNKRCISTGYSRCVFKISNLRRLKIPAQLSSHQK